MQAEIRPSWFKMGFRKLEARLKDEGHTPQVIDSILSRVQYEKAKARAEKIKGTVTFRMWDELLRPARTEVGTVRSMVAQAKAAQRKKPDDESLQVKIDVLSRYAAIVAAVIEKLRKVQTNAELTPPQFAAELKKAGKMPTDGEGTHWVDYVRRADKHAMELAFDKMPAAKRGKTKTPFERRITPDDHFKAKAAMVKRIVNELDGVERELAITTDPERAEKLKAKFEQLHRAQFHLDNLSRTAPIPTSWQGLLK